MKAEYLCLLPNYLMESYITNPIAIWNAYGVLRSLFFVISSGLMNYHDVIELRGEVCVDKDLLLWLFGVFSSLIYNSNKSETYTFQQSDKREQKFYRLLTI